MAQGCILMVDHRDLKQLRTSLKKSANQYALREANRAIREKSKEALARAVTYPLSNPKHPLHEIFKSKLLENVAGGKIIEDAYKWVLSNAVATIANRMPDIPGLIGQNSIYNRGEHRGGNEFAYELLGTAELIRRGKTQSLPSANGGPKLKLNDTDQLDLGLRYQVGDRRVDLSRPISGYEADLLIRRGSSVGTSNVVGVDFVHSHKSGSVDAGFTAQLPAVATSLRDGGIKEFHIVSNGTFSSELKKHVAKINESFDSPKLSLHEKVQFQPN